MAMYEHDGFCPCNEFGLYPYERNPLWEATQKILGDRIGYMVYTKNGAAYGRECASICDALMGGKGTLGIEFACILREMIPYCKYAKKGRKVEITDLLNPHQVDGIYLDSSTGEWKIYDPEDWSKLHLIQDDRYLIITYDDGEVVSVKVFKK